MSVRNAFALAIFAVVPLLGEAAGSAHAQCTLCAIEWSRGRVASLGGLLGATYSRANSINGAGLAVGYTQIGGPFGPQYATEWSGGKAIALPGLLGSTHSEANGVNNAGLAVGDSYLSTGAAATEWSGGKATALGALPGFSVSFAKASTTRGRWWATARSWWLRAQRGHGVERRQSRRPGRRGGLHG